MTKEIRMAKSELGWHNAGVDEKELERDDEQRGFGWFRMVCVCVGLMVGYVLSVGPASKLEKAGLLPGWMQVVYAPLEEAADRIPLLGNFLEWYLIDMWQAVP